MTSSSSAVPKVEKYDVFISFRGEDTRHNFTSHLYEALCDKKIKTYIDEDSLEKGDEIAPALVKAIKKSKICVIVFSKYYASSRWCLDELNHILQWKGEDERVVVPIFYHVDPSHVRHQQGSYETAFHRHKRRFKGEKEKVQKWRDTLAKVADLSGWHLEGNRSESKFIKDIVKDVMKKLDDYTSQSDDDDDDLKDLAGIDEPIKKIESLLSVGSFDVRILGLWGMGGIGKTTLARVIFQKLSSQFEGSLFLENVKEEMKKLQSTELQKIVFSKLLKEKELNEINYRVKYRLRNAKVLFVLDDVDDVRQLEFLAKDRKWFGSGSRIIVTTRNVQLLNNIEADGVYEVEELNPGNALQLFYRKAFHGNNPTTDYVNLSNRVVTNHAKGNPLALKVLGCHLHSRSIEEWKSELEKLESIPHKEIDDVLKISYDGLSNNTKDVFLDIACFFTSTDKKEVERILGYSFVGVTTEIRDLINKSLVTINDKECLIMHDLVRDMGREIVRQQSTVDPGKRSRLWSTKDICHVLKRHQGATELQGISLRMNEVGDPLLLEPMIFKKMCNLRFLDFDYGFGSGGYKKVLIDGDIQLPPDVKYLKWDRFSSRSLAPNFTPENVVELVLCHSQLEHFFIGDKHLENLKVINLSRSRNLNQIEDLITCAPNLEEMDLSFTAIEQVPESIRSLSRLTTLRLDHCYNLGRLPRGICKLKFLRLLSLTYCLELYGLPKILEPMECLEELRLDATRITKLPLSVENLCRLKMLTLSYCQFLEVVPHTIYNVCLEHLDVSFCPKLRPLPKLPNSIKFLQIAGCHRMKKELTSSALLLRSHLYKDFGHNMVTHSDLLSTFKGIHLKTQNLPLRESFENDENEMGTQDLLSSEFSENSEIGTRTEDLPLGEFNENNEIDMGTQDPPLGTEDLIFGESIRNDEIDMLDLSWGDPPTGIEDLIWGEIDMPDLPRSESIKSGKSLDLNVDFFGCEEKRCVHGESDVIDMGFQNDDEIDTWTQDILIAYSDHNTILRQFLILSELDGKNMLVKFQIGIFSTEAVSWAEHHALQSYCIPEIGIHSKGTKIPMWFSSQSQGSVITKKLRLGWYNANFIGFAYCVLLRKGACYLSNFDLQFLIRFKFKSGQTRIKITKRFSIQSNECVSHLVMRSIDKYGFRDVSSAVEVSFEFFKEVAELQSCGIRMLYVQDVEEFCNRNKEFLQYIKSTYPATVVPNPSDHGTTHSDCGTTDSESNAGSSDSRAVVFDKNTRLNFFPALLSRCFPCCSM